MFARLAFVAVICASLAYGAVFDPYSRRYGVCKNTIKTLVETNSGSHCTLISGLLALQTKAGFTSAQNVTYTTWVQSLETSVILNASYATTEAKLQKCAAEFEKFELQYSAIYSKVQFLNISTWGPVDQVCQITKEWNMEGSIELCLPTSANGDCKLFDMLLAGCGADTEKKTALQTFIETRLKTIVKSTTMTQVEIMVEINKAFTTEFFVGAQASWMSFFYSIEFSGYFSFSQWSSVAVTYQQQTDFSVLLGGQGLSCPFILSLNATLSSSTYTTTQKGFIKQLINYFTQQWTTVTTMEERLALISMKFSESCDLSYGYFAVLNSITMQGFTGCWGIQGTWWDLIILSCQKPTLPTDCGCVKPTWAPEVPTTIPVEITTEVTATPTVEVTDFSTPSSDAFTWDSTFSSITFESSTPGCSCSCEM